MNPLTLKRTHIDHIQHLDKIGDLEGLDEAMRKYVAFLAEWKRKGIHNV
jgi:hypothetical protein